MMEEIYAHSVGPVQGGQGPLLLRWREHLGDDSAGDNHSLGTRNDSPKALTVNVGRRVPERSRNSGEGAVEARVPDGQVQPEGSRGCEGR